jgi:hypothetical protein
MAPKYNTTALVAAVKQVFEIANRNERSVESLLDQLNEITDAVDRGRSEYRANVMAAQRAELAELRARAARDPA